jgi:acetylornithine deacetylase/succinyl-diaminopimelate desuccinylase-like protein
MGRGTSPVTSLFLDLVRIPSPSGREREVGLFIRNWLADLGVQADFDGTGTTNDSDAGNLIATVVGAKDAPSHLFVAHMDTVESGIDPIEPVLGADGVIRSAGDTILGADNKSAVAALMRLCQVVAAQPADERSTIYAVFTCREETGTMGASLLDLGDRTIDYAYCLDGSDPVGTVITRALGQTVFTVVIRGRSAHAAADPDAGLSAIRVAGELVVAVPLGRQSGGGSVSIAAIVGGGVVRRLSPAARPGLDVGDDASGDDLVLAALEATATNSIPDVVYLRGEVRGYSQKDMSRTLGLVEATVARTCDAHGADYEWRVDFAAAIPPMPGGENARAIELVAAAASEINGAEFVPTARPVTIEANYLAPTYNAVALASGGRKAHQTSEEIAIIELEQLEALLVRIVAIGIRTEIVRQ